MAFTRVFRYINPGYTSLFNDGSLVTQIQTTAYSKTGSAVLLGDAPEGHDGNSVTASFNFRKPIDDDYDVLNNIKFDFYAPANQEFDFVYRCRNYDLHLYTVEDYKLKIQFIMENDEVLDPYNDNEIASTYIPGGLNSIRVYDLGNYTFALSLNDYGDRNAALVMSEAWWTERDNNLQLGFWKNIASPVYISNIISGFHNGQSWVPPSFAEIAVKVPASATSTDWTEGQDDVYTADATDQTFMQSPDVSNLISTYGASAKITSVMVRANPAYRTGEKLTMLAAQMQSGDAITVGSFDYYDLTLNPNDFVADGWNAYSGDVSDGVSLSDFQNMQFGWKAMGVGD